MKKVVIVIPAYKENETLKKNVMTLYSYLNKNLSRYNWKIALGIRVAPSPDRTMEIGQELAKRHKRIIVYEGGSIGATLKKVWLAENADYYAVMDSDLSTDIRHTIELVRGLDEGYDIVNGSRTAGEANRTFRRHIMSTVLVKILQFTFNLNITDFQCGFKAINRKIRDRIVPQIKRLDYGFMSAELLIVAAKKGYKIKEIPVKWNDVRQTRIRLFGASMDALKNILKIKWDLARGNYKD